MMYGILHALLRAWLDYRVRIAFLQRLEKNPSLLGPEPDIATAFAGLLPAPPRIQRQNYALTGLVLALIGVGCAVTGRLMRSGEFAVGMFLAGVFCLILGMAIGLLGFIIRVMTRPAPATVRDKT